ncbi:MAG: NAD kinase [Muribaculaceae bacterium]|nr:NAD kinase [Muribaculaceae bacterium]
MKQMVIFGNTYQDVPSARVLALLDALRQRGVGIAVEKEYLQHLCGDSGRERGLEAFEASQVPDADMALSLGGDGTFLTTAMWVSRQGMPILGINLGHLGYLTAGCLDEGMEIIDEVMAGKYRIEERSMLQVSCDAVEIPHPWALNEIAILRHDTSSMLDMLTSLCGSELTTYRGDGLIVSTPTGSTAYNMSVGGPILEPTTACLVLSPISPHSLTMRPLVVRDDSQIAVRTHTRATHYEVSIDGEVTLCPTGSVLTIERAPYCARVVQLQGKDFANTLRQKLLWGTDRR